MADPYGDGKGLKQQQRQKLKPALEVEDFINLLHGSDPVRVELTRLENELQCNPHPIPSHPSPQMPLLPDLIYPLDLRISPPAVSIGSFLPPNCILQFATPLTDCR